MIDHQRMEKENKKKKWEKTNIVASILVTGYTKSDTHTHTHRLESIQFNQNQKTLCFAQSAAGNQEFIMDALLVQYFHYNSSQ